MKFHRVLAEVKNEAEAIELVDTVDNERREFIKHYFNAEWPSRHLYHAMLNTAIGEDATVDTHPAPDGPTPTNARRRAKA